VLAWPLALAVLHNGGAAALVAVLVVINVRCAGVTRVADPGARSRSAG
jgi:heme A synthase